MPANRRSRRARAARARRAPRPAREPLGLGARLGLGLAGVGCIAVALIVLLTPHGTHIARGFGFLLVLGGALLVAAWVA